MRRAPLPDRFRSGAFRVRDAADDLNRNRLRAHDLDRPVWGIRRHDVADDALRDRVEAFAARLRPEVFFSHTTAALLHGIPLPWWHERHPLVHAAILAPGRAPHANGLRGHRLDGRTRIVTRDGLRVTSPSDTWRDLASMLTLVQLVAAGDRIVHHRDPMAGTAELAATIRRSSGRRGIATLRAALPLLDDRAESPPESELRVILELGGLPPPRINHVVVDAEGGQARRVDLAYDDLLFAIEYQGDYHRTRTQWRRDMTRRSQLEAAGWYVLEVNADDLRRPGELISRIHAVLARRARIR
jgi:hypothetical protein